MQMQKDARVKLSFLAIERGIRKQADPNGKILGTVVQQPKPGATMRSIVWDGITTRGRFHIDFLEEVTGDN